MSPETVLQPRGLHGVGYRGIVQCAHRIISGRPVVQQTGDLSVACLPPRCYLTTVEHSSDPVHLFSA